MLFSPKRTCFRFAALTLRVQGSQRDAAKGETPQSAAADSSPYTGEPKGRCEGGNPSVRCGGQLPLHRGAKGNPSGAAAPAPPFAPTQLFELRRCCAWLIKIREHTVLSYLKRSCFRFAALTLRLRTVTPLRDIPVFRSAYFTQRVHSTLCSKTLDLQVRCAHPTGRGEPKIPPPPFPAGAGTSEKEMRRKTEGRSAEKLLK